MGYKYERLSRKERISGFRSFLLGFPKLYEYELHFLKTENESYNILVKELE